MPAQRLQKAGVSLLRSSRRQHPAPPSEAGASPAPGGTDAAAGTLCVRLREIAGAAAAPEEALEPALHAILQASHAQAGALCLYDVRQSILRLTAEVGLSDEGCRRLRSVRRSDPTAWDMPLQGLLNRRAYLIESAARNRYVPPLVENTAAVRTIACVPIYAGPAPLGSLILVALAPRCFGERDIRALGRAVSELGTMIEAVRSRVDGATKAQRTTPRAPAPVDRPDVIGERDRLREEAAAARVAEHATVVAELAARAAEAERLREALDAASAERAALLVEVERARAEAQQAASRVVALEAVEHERARLATALEAAAAERGERTRAELVLEEALVGAQRAAAAAAEELDRVRRGAVAAQAQAEARAAELVAGGERLQARLEQADETVARERALARELERERERLAHELAAAAGREDRLRHELERASEKAASAGEHAVRQALEAARAAEEARGAAVAEVEALRAAYASAQEVILALEDEAAAANAEVERVGAAAHGQHEQLESALADARARELAATGRVTELVHEAEALRAEHRRLAAGSRQHAAEAADVAARLEFLVAERDRLRDAVAAGQAERDRLLAAAGAAERRLGDSVARETVERARLTAALGTTEAALGELQVRVARQDAEATERAATIEQLRAECDRLRADRGARAEPSPAPRSEQPVRVVTLAPAGGTRGRAREPDRRVAAVLDVDGAWANMAIDGHEVAVLSPAEDVAERLATLVPARLIVNLAAPAALDMLATLRAAGSATRFWGCIADPASDRVLALGMIEPAASPLDPDALVDVLGSYAQRGARVVTAGSDVDALMSLRQALARAGLSVSMAWDAKQAADLLQVVRPELVIVDLALPRRDGYAIVGRLAELDPPPSAVVIPGAEDPAPGFAGVLVDPAHAGRTLTLTDYLAGVLGRSEAAPSERRQKVRAVSRK